MFFLKSIFKRDGFFYGVLIKQFRKLNKQDKNLKGISFDYKEKHYEGELCEVSDAGANVWHLMVNNCYKGTLMYTDKWVFHSNKNEMKELAELFGEQVTLWYE